ncbi:MAG TPA: DUF1206 domain-containing protein [Gaiellaceae bacterium]|nr:DUF1206 domain-containing protein [Gaiellaceae bacterium]
MSALHTGRAESAARGASEGFVDSTAFEVLARAGFVARGLVYAIIGILAFKLAIGSGGKLTNQQGALKTVAHQQFGHLLLTLLAIGLGGYSLWRIARAAIGHGPEGSDKGFDRLAALGSGIAYGAMCAIAVEILLGGGSGGSSGKPSKATGGVLGWPGGTWIVGIAGAVMVGIALYQGYRGITQSFLDDSKTEQMSAAVRRWISRVGTVGHMARMVVFGLVGIFLVKAAIEYQPTAAVGLDGALAKLAHQSYGSWLLGLVAAGLVAFAVYSLSDARYRRI